MNNSSILESFHSTISAIVKDDFISSQRIYEERLINIAKNEIAKLHKDQQEKAEYFNRKFNEFLTIVYGMLTGQEILKLCLDPSIYILGNFGTKYSIHFEIFSNSLEDEESPECGTTVYFNKEVIANEFGDIFEIANNLKSFIQKTTILDEIYISNTLPKSVNTIRKNLPFKSLSVPGTSPTEAWV
ncbi:hypothetical protein [Leptospira interrogans]|uniref:hypothetical protein n=1 Tax=Leptospira interrogans TaxID=173 RepID=UPI000774E371|nr:hypothetical protein [Leptospira interrogans]